MKVIDLIMLLAKMPQELEVIYQKDETDEGFKMEVVEDVDEVTVDNGDRYVMINPGHAIDE